MRKIIFFLVLSFLALKGKSQLTDAQLIAQADTIKYETKVGANTAIRVGRMFENIIYNKVNPLVGIPYLSTNNTFTGINTFPSIVLASNGIDTFATKGYARSVGGASILPLNNKFTGNDTFPTIAVLNNSYGAGIKTSGDTTIIGDVLNADNGTKLTVNDDISNVSVEGSFSVSGLANIGGSLTVDNTTIPYFSGDTTLNAAGGGAVPIMNAVKGYVYHHSSGGSFIDTTKIPYLAKNNNFTGIDSFTTTVTSTLSIIDSVPKINNSTDTISSRSYVRNYVQANIPTPTYTEFSALAYQSGTNPPTDTSILINTTSRTITYTYNSTGNYTLNISGASIPKPKIVYFIGGNLGIVNMSYSSNTITITSYSDALTLSNGILNFTPITIKIYN